MRSVLLAICAVLVIGVPASAEPAKRLPIRPSGVAAHLVRAGRPVPEPRPTTVGSLIRSAGDLRDAATRIRAGKRIGELLAGEPVAASEDEPFYVQDPVPAGDLDADGRDDVVLLQIQASGWSLAARRGVDGSPLWMRRAIDGYTAYPQPVGDLTGDGHDDIVVFSDGARTDAALGCDDLTSCVYSRTEDGPLLVQLWSGATGTVVWSRRLDLFATETWLRNDGPARDAGVYASVAWQLYGQVVAVNVAGDHDADGSADLVLHVFTPDSVEAEALTFQDGAAAGIEDRWDLISTTATVVSGRTGRPLIVLAHERSIEPATLSVVGDTNADGVPDLAWSRSSGLYPAGGFGETWGLGAAPPTGAWAVARSEALTVDLLDGATLSVRWATAVSDATSYSALVRPVSGDANGDGHDDLLADVSRGVAACVWSDSDVCTYEWETVLLSGADGSVVWRSPTDYILGPLGPVGGGPGDDLLTLSLEPDGEDAVFTFGRIDGATGSVLFDTQPRVPIGEGFFFGFGTVSDADGDAVREPTFWVLPLSPLGHTSYVDSGRTGDILLRYEVDTALFGGPSGDLDADGGPELVVGAGVGQGDRIVWTTRALSVRAGEPLWSHVRETSDRTFPWLVVTGDLCGGPGDDLLTGTLSFDGAADTFAVLTGADRTPCWIGP